MAGRKGCQSFTRWLRSTQEAAITPAVLLSNIPLEHQLYAVASCGMLQLQFQHNVTGKRHYSSSSSNIGGGRDLSPAEAGKMAFRKRLEMTKKKNLKCDDHPSSSTPSTKSLDTILSHAGLKPPCSNLKSESQILNQNEPLCPPINFETTYTRPPSGDYTNVEEGGKGLIYGRMGNPTRSLLEDVLTNLELASNIDATENTATAAAATTSVTAGDAVTCAFSSGMAAVSSIILALSNNSNSTEPLHVFLPDDIYHGVPSQLKTVFAGGGKVGGSTDRGAGVTYSAVDMTNIEHLKEELMEHVRHLESKSSTRGNNINNNILIWMESPSNPLCKVTDIEEVCTWVQDFRSFNSNVNISTVVDSTWAPPYLSQPLLLGADAVLHSGTKYLAGHSDVLIGSVTTSPKTTQGRELGSRVRQIQSALGATASPMDCWLTLRGLRTLHIRLERQCRSAMEIANFLNNHPLVKSVHYPGLEGHPQHQIAARQMKYSFGGMLSFEMADEAAAMAVAGAVSIIQRATSLGGTETLIEHRASIEPDDGRVSPMGLLRLSVGLEDVEDLKRDLEVALQIGHSITGNVSG
mmetsp:Transcript_5014/g.7381  ORF Transcript_5014/g.7381 Transcript_5014/m.7381 type:complete len:578 (+) Transcript_5014:154-1887(+)